MTTDDEKLIWRIQQIEERAKEDRENYHHSLEHVTAELDDLKRDHLTLKSDYEKMISRSAGVFVAVLSVGGFIGWLITQLKDFFIRNHV